MWVRQITSIYVTNKARINSRTEGGGDSSRGFVGVEQAQIRHTLKVAENVYNTISVSGVGALLYLAKRLTAKEMSGLVH